MTHLIALFNRADLSMNSPFVLAYKNRHLEMVKFFVENGADVNAKDRRCNTVLLYAAKNGHFESF